MIQRSGGGRAVRFTIHPNFLALMQGIKPTMGEYVRAAVEWAMQTNLWPHLHRTPDPEWYTYVRDPSISASVTAEQWDYIERLCEQFNRETRATVVRAICLDYYEALTLKRNIVEREKLRRKRLVVSFDIHKGFKIWLKSRNMTGSGFARDAIDWAVRTNHVVDLTVETLEPKDDTMYCKLSLTRNTWLSDYKTRLGARSKRAVLEQVCWDYYYHLYKESM